MRRSPAGWSSLVALAVAALAPLARTQVTPAGMSGDDWTGEPFPMLPPVGALLRLDEQSERAGLDRSRPDSRPPAGVRFAERAPHESWWLRVLLSRTEQVGLRDKRSDLGSSELFARGFAHAPHEMTSDRFDFQVLYGMEPDTTLFAELPWISRDMEVDTPTGAFDNEVDGLGDLRVGVVTEVESEPGRVLDFVLGLSLPTGAVDEDGRDEVGARLRLPYAMQPGSGTFDLHPGLNWICQNDAWTFGAQGQWRVHLGRNGEGWARGDEGEISTWAARGLSATTAASLRLRGLLWSDVHGQDDRLDPDRNPLEDRTRQGGERVDAILGVAWQLGDGVQAVRSLSLEFGVPIAEWLDGPGLSTRAWGALAWQYSF